MEHAVALGARRVGRGNKRHAAEALGLALPVFLQGLAHLLRHTLAELLRPGLLAPIVNLVNQDADVVRDELRGAAAVGADGRRAARRALDEDHAKGLLVGGEHAHLRRREQLGEHVLALGAQEERPLQLQLLREALVQLDRLRWAAAHDHRGQVRELGLILLRGIEHHIQALPIGELAHEGHHLLDVRKLALVLIAQVLV
mmetsp:Transcript_76133/g.210573  ORF Transcript_76133/g.210573 Transcript_76133/m.210573 type:complete len:200 (-) Transcript_76133:847-1446(-)